MLRTARVVIVDEIHAVVQSRRGAHLALSLERLDHVCGRPLQRIGLSATQKPIEEVARFLTRKPCAIVDKGHRRKMDLAVEVPNSPLEAVMSHEVWAEIYQRLVQLIDEHRTTLITVNTRRLAERMAQQIVAETAAEEEWDEEALYRLCRQAYPYRRLQKAQFIEVVEMLARGYATRRGRRGALLHYDSLNHKLRSRKGSRMSAITNGGAIPEVFDYRVMLEPEGHFIGTLNEDFAIESLPGDVFQLGNTSWRILRIGNGVVRVADAQGQPPSMPFWLGEAPARSDEMSVAVSQLRAAVDFELPGPDEARKDDELEGAIELLMRDYRLSRSAAEQIARYLAEAKRSLGVVPTVDQLALERFFDESGGMQLVLHAPFGSRINRAWGLALRKKFCQGFNFELQAAATEEGVILSLGTAHSFPLEEVFRYLHPNTVRATLVQAILDSPIFETRWRWSTTLALAVPRNRRGARIPNQLQRMCAEDLLQAAFPEAAACQDNIQGA